MLRLLLVFFSLLSAPVAMASHYKGGEIVYTYLGSGSYKIKAYTYWTSGCSVSLTHSATLTTHYTITSALAKTSDTTSNGTQECIYEQTVNFTTSVTDEITWSSSARVSGGSNFTAGSFGLSTKIIYNASDDTKNTSSPSFGSKPFYQFSSSDTSISFSLNASLPSSASDTTWGYRKFTLSTPVGVTSPYASMSNFSINTLTGQVSWGSPAAGLWLVNVKVSETDSAGTETGAYIFRDFMITISATSNHKPVFGSVSASSLIGTSSSAYTLTVTATDTDNDNITLTATGAALTSGATFTQSTTGASVSGTLTWTTPVAGLYAVQFTATDDNATSLFAQLDVTIGIDVPVAYDGTDAVNPNYAPLNGTLSASDPNSTPLTYSIVTAASHGTATITNANTGAYSYTPANGYTGTDVFGFKAYNGTAYSNIGTMTITVSTAVTPTNTSPTLGTNTGMSITLGQTRALGNTLLQATDTEQAAAALTYTLTLPPRNGKLLKNGSEMAASATFTQADIDNGNISYAHTTQTNGDAFSFTVGDGTVTLSAATFSITVSNMSVLPDLLTLGGWASCLIYNSGSLACWGDASSNKIPGATGSVNAPTPVTLQGMQQLSIGRRHGCFLRTNGTIACFGEGSEGQMGTGEASSSSSTVTVSGFGQ